MRHKSAISDGRAVEIANGIDPDTNEGIEYGDGGGGRRNFACHWRRKSYSNDGGSLNQESYTGGSEFLPYTKIWL